MNHRIASLFSAGLVAAAAALNATAVWAQDWPARPIRMVVPAPPGGSWDIAARVVSQKLTERLKPTVIVENRAGAAGNIGMEAASKAAPDGYTFLYANTALVTNPFTHKLNFDPVKDFVPVSRVAGATFVLVTNLAFPPHSVAEIIALARAKPKEVTCAHPGSLPQIGCELLRTLARIDITSVPYKGTGPALNDVTAGHVHMLFDVQISAMLAVRAGRVRAIATASSRRGWCRRNSPSASSRR